MVTGVDYDSHFNELDAGTLEPYVREAIGSSTAEVTDWSYERMPGGTREFAGNAHYRLSVTGNDGSESLSYSFVVKIHCKQPVESAPIPPHTEQELGVYRSGVAVDVPGGLVAAHCYDIVEHPDSWWLWLEDVEGVFETWPLEQFARTARHLGQFNAAFLDDPPSEEWCDPFEFDLQRPAPAIALLDERPDDPIVSQFFDDETRAAVFNLWAQRNELLELHASLSRTFCHFDAFPPNLFAQQGADGWETVAIDWELAGVGPLGADPAVLTYLSHVGTQGNALEDLITVDTTVFDNYIDGLREAGWDGDVETVRKGYTVHMCLRWLQSIGQLRRILGHEPSLERLTDQLEAPTEEFVEKSAITSQFLSQKADTLEEFI